jgi:asparagine synthase (glutamine-hydrolysing)
MAIAGIMRFGEPRPVDRDLDLMAAALTAYGGDRVAAWSEATVGLLRTLPRRTPEDAFDRALRPAPEAPHVVFADLRIDNRAELARRLGVTADAAASMPDSELARLAWAAWQTELHRHLVGAFAIAVWERGSATLHCIRDHVGQRPLFFHQGADFIAFASMPSILLALDQVPCRLDEPKMAELLVGCHLRTDVSPFRDIQRLPAGSRLEAAGGRQHVVRYWDVARCPAVEHETDADYAREARALLRESTAARLRSVGPIGAALSGGLDSSAITCAAAERLQDDGRNVIALHRTPPDGFARQPPRTKLLHEAAFVDALARRYANVEVAYVRQGAGRLLEGLAERTRLCQRPVSRVANHHWFHSLWSQARNRNVGVLLVGGAGDLTFSWGGQGELAELARRGRWLTLARLLPLRARWLEVPAARVLRSHVVGPLVRELQHRAAAPFVPDRSLRHAAAQSPVRGALLEELNMAGRLHELGWEIGVPRPLQQRCLRVLQANAYDDAAGEIHTGLEAMYGFEFRDPFRDRRVFEFSFGIPPLQYVVGGADRSLLRRAAAGLIPDVILERRKKGAQAVDWAERLIEAKDDIRDELAQISRSPLASHILDVPRMSAILESARLEQWTAAQDASTPFEPGGTYGSLMRDYNEVLLKGIAAGMFLRWLEAGARP